VVGVAPNKEIFVKRLSVCIILTASALTLVGCEESPNSPHSNSTSYGYRQTPGMYSHPTQYSKLPARTESRGPSTSVAGFPPGHPLHKDDSFDQQQHSYDQRADEHPVRHHRAGDPSSYAGQRHIPNGQPGYAPQNHVPSGQSNYPTQNQSTALPHTNLNY
jgi:hypothetical protein